MYKVGDKVKVIEILCDDYKDGIRLGDIFEVTKIRTNLSVGIKWKRTDYYPLINDQIEKVEESKENDISRNGTEIN